jgi:hypothetical protein
MKIRRVLLALLGAAALVTPLTLTSSAEAAVPEKPITCGMVVHDSMNLYLANDLYCPDTAVRIGQDNGRDDPVVPTVNVDLRGHKLRGPGTGFGIWSNSYPGQANVRVTNGVVKSWANGIAGDSNTNVSGVARIDNDIAYFCNENCTADLVVFKNNRLGMHAAGESNAIVTRSTFIGNDVAAGVSSIWTLNIDRSLFTLNKVGVRAIEARPIVSNTAFVKNETAIYVQAESPTEPQTCAALTNVTFAANKKNLVGPRCTS